MSFKMWLESSLNDLYDSAVAAFPKTELRQHATETIKIVDLSIIPYKGMKTIFFKGLAQNEGREHITTIVFKEVDYSKGIRITATDGLIYELKPLSLSENNVLVRCSCGDFRWRGIYANYLDSSLYGKKKKKYESLGVLPPVNPTNAPMLCKHLISMAQALRNAGILKD